MKVIHIDVQDGEGMIAVAASTTHDELRLQSFIRAAGDAFVDKERWEKISRLMTHEHSGLNIGWTLGVIMPGDTPDEAVDNYYEQAT